MKNFFLVLILQIFIAQFVLIDHCWGQGLLKVKVQPFSLVEHKKVRLGDIAVITGDEPELVEAAQSIVLASAPLMNRSIFMGKGLIKKALLKNGFDLKTVNLFLPDKIIVKNKLIRISKDKVEEAIREYIYKNMPWRKEQIAITQIDLKEDIFLPSGEIDQKISVKENSSFIGKVPLYLEFKVNGKVFKRKIIKANIKVLMPVVLTKASLKRNQIISESDIYIEKKWLSKVSSGLYTSIDEVIGKEIKRNIKAGQPLLRSQLKIPAVIKRGNKVTILAETNTLKITTTGIAGENGTKGQTIKVKNLVSNKIIYARVVNSTTVKVDF